MKGRVDSAMFVSHERDPQTIDRLEIRACAVLRKGDGPPDVYAVPDRSSSNTSHLMTTVAPGAVVDIAPFEFNFDLPEDSIVAWLCAAFVKPDGSYFPAY